MKSLRHTAIACLLTLAALQPLHANEPVNINTADAETLAAAIDGVGLKRAEAIIRYREMNGPFSDVEALTEVRGIGPKVLEKARERLTTR